MRAVAPGIHKVDARHLAAAESIEPYVLDRRWYEVGRTLAGDEDMAGSPYRYAVLHRAFIALGYHNPPHREFFSNAVRSYRGMKELRIQRDRLRGMSERFPTRLLYWYDRDEISREDILRLLVYRQRYFNGQHPVSMRLFELRDYDTLQDLLRHERSYRQQHA
jgi:hypothetical protein